MELLAEKKRGSLVESVEQNTKMQQHIDMLKRREEEQKQALELAQQKYDEMLQQAMAKMDELGKEAQRKMDEVVAVAAQAAQVPVPAQPVVKPMDDGLWMNDVAVALFDNALAKIGSIVEEMQKANG